MKRWHKRSICILIAGIIGVGALSIRTAIEPDRQITHSTNPIHCHYSNAEQQLTFNDCWQLCDETTDNEVFSALQSQDIHIDIRTADGKLLATYDTPILHSRNAMDLVETVYQASLFPIRTKGHTHEYIFSLRCSVQLTGPFWQTPLNASRYYTKKLSVDIPPAPVQQNTEQTTTEEVSVQEEQAQTPPAPGTPAQEALKALKNELISLAQQADAASISAFITHAEQAALTHTDTTRQWPDCWHDAANDASCTAELVQEAITTIRNNNYWNSTELADCIAGEAFSRIFGSAHRGNTSSFIEDELGTGLEDMIFIQCDEDFFNEDEEKN